MLIGMLYARSFTRIDVDLILPDESADAGDFRHARNRVELITDKPILRDL